MKKILTLARYTFLELVRQKLVLINLLVAIFLFLFSLVLGSLTFDEKLRVVTHVCLTVVHFSLIFIATILGSSLLDREIQRQTCLIILARPVSRFQFLLGKLLGIIFLILSGWVLLSLCTELLVWGELPMIGLIQSLFSILLEAILLLVFTMAASTFLRPAISFLAAVGVYFVGHWTNDLKFFAERSESALLKGFAKISGYIFPHLENLNWRSVGLIQSGISGQVFSSAVFHAISWILFLTVGAYCVFRRKDLV
jgi:Cu-processing system permease protein